MTPDSRAEVKTSPTHSCRSLQRIGSFRPELGGFLHDVTLAYETWGELNPDGDNVVLLTHALTGDSHAGGEPCEQYKRGGWWNPLIGPGCPIDTDKYFVICPNVLGGCSGSTGPASIDPETGNPYGMRFPLVTIRDMVRAQKRLLDILGASRLSAVIGGSIGGQQALEWAVKYPEMVERCVPVAASGALGAQGIAMSEIGRRAIMADQDWQGGDYYGTGRSPDEGLAVARMAGMVTYQSAESQNERFGRKGATRPPVVDEFGGRFEVESYLHCQGRDLADRFDANSYLYLSRAMDLYDVSSGYSSEEAALKRIKAETTFVGISSDWLFPPDEVRQTAEKAGAGYAEVESPNGHDAFLKDFGRMEEILRPFLNGEKP